MNQTVFLLISGISILLPTIGYIRNLRKANRRLREESNYRIVQFLKWANVNDYLSTSSLTNSLTMLREEYLKNDPKKADTFDVPAYSFIHRFFETQDNALMMRARMNKGHQYTDPEVEEMIAAAVIANKDRIIELFEKEYEEIKDVPGRDKERFIDAVRYRYFEPIKLEHRFFDRIVAMEKEEEAVHA